MAAKTVGIIGAGASGCIAAYYLIKSGFDVTLFDYSSPLRTILPTGGGRCNFAHGEYDFKELAKNYPRGEKFLFSVFSRFSTYETLSLFKELGIKTYMQDDKRFFPVSNDSKEVRSKILDKIKKSNFIKEEVNSISKLDNGYKIKTNKSEYYFPQIIIATGGGLKSKQILGLEHKIIPYKPSLVGLKTQINPELSGLVLKEVYNKECKLTDDLLFTHFGVSGPLIYKISSIKARENFPYKLTFDLYNKELDFQSLLNSNPHKDLKNILSLIFPNRFAEFLSKEYSSTKACNINGKIRDLILNKIHNYEVEITGTDKGEETVTSGGFDLNEINPKTMESKLYPNLYIIGEALDIDGFCGGFNLQNAWSTAFIATESIITSRI